MFGMGLGFGILGPVFMVLFWGGLIALAVWLARGLFGNDSRRSSVSPTGDGLSAQAILDERYARGEITREQYELMKSDLK